jgi:hypothetical protein
MSRRVIAGAVMLAIWLLLGPVAMAFDGCMGCELPCAQLACAIAAPVPTAAPGLVSSAVPGLELHPTTAIPSTLELPPKALLSAAA